jgi:hypothetical protein
MVTVESHLPPLPPLHSFPPDAYVGLLVLPIPFHPYLYPGILWQKLVERFGAVKVAAVRG